MPTVDAVTAYLKEFAPLELAAEWDNVGLLLGDPAAAARRVMTCLTVTPETVAEAVDEGVGLIVSHHPILFRPSKRLTTATAEGRMLLSLAAAGCAVYSPHTAFDNAHGGINDILARRLGLADAAPLRTQPAARQCKVVVFVPEKDLTKVSDAMFGAGAGRIGAYSECSFRIPGTGTFFGSDETNPTVGQKGRREEAQEYRLEVVCPEGIAEKVIAAMRAAHSYEEPAFDLYPLGVRQARVGPGRVGNLPSAVPLRSLAETVRTELSAATVQLVGDPDRPVRRVAVACGAAGEFAGDAARQKADVFLTGEMRFHDCLAAQTQGLSVILPGHYATERCGIEELAELIKKKFPSLDIWASRQERDLLIAL